jgi:gliding motility-associated lipoprotein GldH
MNTNQLKAVKLLSVLVSIFFLSSCSNNTVFESYHKFENLNWKRFDIQKFEFEVENIDAEYDVFLSIRHIPEIPYKEMLINYTIYTPSGDMRSNDLTMELYNNEGNKLSECLGDLCDFVYPIRTSMKFSELGTIKFEIENKYTRVDMPGIMEVGLIIKIAE